MLIKPWPVDQQSFYPIITVLQLQWPFRHRKSNSAGDLETLLFACVFVYVCMSMLLFFLLSESLLLSVTAIRPVCSSGKELLMGVLL